MTSGRFDTVEQEVRRLADRSGFSGAVLLTERGETLLELGVGYADRASRIPVTPATRFGTASVTKMFTAATVVRLVLEGRLALDSAVVDLLPPARRPGTLLPEVTVHHLLCHTSHLADYFEEEPDAGEPIDYADLWHTLPTYEVTSPADFLPLFADLEPYGPPSEEFRYSNAGYIVLGLVVEEVTGRPFAEAATEHVLGPCGMADSGFLRFDEVLPDVATGYVRDGDGWRTNIYSMPVVGGADGGALCTARDLDRFLTAYDEWLLGDLHDVVLTPHTDMGDGFGEGYGVHLYPDGRFGHGGGDPGVDVLVHRWSATQTNLVVLANVEETAGEVRDLVIGAWRSR